jgi:NAD(P)-dependent dehydrogenase (short-subunit alcohol dehydrogenase family)
MRVALVTGGNRGIGREVCRQLAARGCHVLLSARDGGKAEAAARELGRDVTPIALDVTSAPSIARAAAAIDRTAGRVDILVNNAGILLGEADALLEISADDLRRTFETNVFGAIAVAQAFVPGMVARRDGRVVNVSSQAGQLASMRTYAPAYSMSKAALNAFTRQLAAATRGAGVLVNSACPGWVRTDMGGPGAPLSVAEGADTIVWLATLGADGPTGGFFSRRKRIEW